MYNFLKIVFILTFSFFIHQVHSQCEPIYTVGCGVNQLDYFELEEIVNSPAEPCESLNGTGWSQYLELGPATLTQGTTYSFYISCGSAGAEKVSVWIDFNDDLVLSEEEKVISNFLLLNGGVNYEIPVDIPTDAKLGIHFMRVRHVGFQRLL